MANNYRQFCEAIKYPETEGDREEAIRWWNQVAYTDPNDFDTPEEFDARLTELGINVKEVDTEHFPDFQCDVESDGVVIYSEGYGNVANVGEVVRAYLARFMPVKVWSMEWAEYCDRTRLNENGGGVLAVSDKEVLIKTTLDLRSDLVAELRTLSKLDMIVTVELCHKKGEPFFLITAPDGRQCSQPGGDFDYAACSKARTLASRMFGVERCKIRFIPPHRMVD